MSAEQKLIDDITEISVIDLSKVQGDFPNVDEAELKVVADKFGTALNQVGFAYLVNHGVDMELVRNVHKISREFFELPVSVKGKYRKPDPIKSYHGYFGPGDEFFNEQEKNSVELRELFDINCGMGDDEKNFPSEVPGFKIAIAEFKKSCNNLIKKILRSLAIYLKLEDQDYFVKNHSGIEKHLEKTHGGIRTMFYYPMKSIENLPPNAIRLGEHTDWGSITLLFQDMIGGLEVKKTNGEWIHATPIKDAVLINCGQLLDFWTAGVLPATPHRVRVMNDEFRLQNPRQSLIYFCSPDGFVEVKPIVPIPEGKEKYAERKPIIAYDHYQRLIDYATS
jgi:isopenicillin N synthase-like dioxygenase